MLTGKQVREATEKYLPVKLVASENPEHAGYIGKIGRIRCHPTGGLHFFIGTDGRKGMHLIEVKPEWLELVN